VNESTFKESIANTLGANNATVASKKSTCLEEIERLK
jgi:hypothetical protein